MKLSEYLEMYGKRSMSKLEAKVFKIPDMRHGWKVRYADCEITEGMLAEFSSYSGCSTKQKMRVRRKLTDKANAAEKWENVGTQLLYLMRNPNGLLKIGISKEPAKRAKALSNASGVLVYLVAVWAVDRNVRQIENKLHKSAQPHRLEGEWFSRGSVSANWVEVNLVKFGCGFERVFEETCDD